MGSQDYTDPIWRFQNDGGLDRFANLSVGSSSNPRRSPYADMADDELLRWVATDDTAFISSEGYSVSSVAGGRTSSMFSPNASSHASTLSTRDDNRAGGASQSYASSARSGYTSSAVSRAPSIYSSDASSYAPSVFTRASARTSAGLSSHPPQRAHITNFVQTLAAAAAADYAPVDDAPPVLTANINPLWCELCVLANCNATFRLDQTHEWINHHSRHVNDRYPGRLVCWFCDHVPFVAVSKNDRYANFEDRMMHIREHISSEELTRDHMRPDFFMINHLADRGHIDDRMRRHALGYSELPDVLRLPGSSADGGSQSYQPPRRQPGPGLAHDLDRERRHQRPRGGQRAQRSSSQYP